MSLAIAADSACAEAEKRSTTRFGCVLSGECRPADPLDSASTWPAHATNISRGGVNLKACRRFEPGTIIVLQFTSFPAEGAFMPLAKVRHVRLDGVHWQFGCTWSRELTGEELRALVGRSDVQRHAA
jgi:hypothetical protein